MPRGFGDDAEVSREDNQTPTWADVSAGPFGGVVTKPAHEPATTGARQPNEHKDHDPWAEYQGTTGL
ncbi:hypothetical protein TNCT6_12890 [Streptomyces sp. 6-11-2]|nr:hypothetical protein TNCT6_12890 [Streptomyces sp. 6-11-2]